MLYQSLVHLFHLLLAAQDPSKQGGADPIPVVPSKPSISAVPLIPRARLFNNPDKMNVQFSPDGRVMSFLAPYDGVMNIWVQDLEQLLNGTGKAEPVTFDGGRGIQGFTWTYLPGVVVYVQDSDGDENWRVWKLNVTRKPYLPEVVSATAGVRASIQEVSHKEPDVLVLAMNDRNPQYQDLYRVNLTSGSMQLYLQNDMFKSFHFDNDMVLRFAGRENAQGGTEFMRAVWSDNASEIVEWRSYRNLSFDDDSVTSLTGFDKTNQQLMWIDSEDSDLGVFLTHPIDAPANKTIIYTPEKAEISSVFVHPIERTVLAIRENYDKPHFVIYDQSVQGDFDYLSAIDPKAVLYVSQVSLDFSKWLVTLGYDDAPGKYYLYDRLRKKATYLFTTREDLKHYRMSKMYPVEITSRDGFIQQCYLSLPLHVDKWSNGIPSEPVPMVVDVHGGPWTRSNWGMATNVQHMTNRGYAVLQCNYRGSTGFGKNYTNEGNGEWARKMHDDIIDSVNWAIAKKIAIPNKIAIEGGSYGGYATLVGLSMTPDVFACGVDLVGPSNLITLVNSIPAYWKPQYNSFVRRLGADPATEEGKKFLDNRSPLTFAHKINKPLLIGQGANDPRVKMAEADQIVKALKKNNIPVTYLLYPNEGHGFARPENRMNWYAMMETFLGDCLGGRVEPLTREETIKSSVRVVEDAHYLQKLKRPIRSQTNRQLSSPLAG